MDDVVSLTDVVVGDSLTARLSGHVTSRSNASISAPGEKGRWGEGPNYSACAVAKHLLPPPKFALVYGAERAHRKPPETVIKGW